MLRMINVLYNLRYIYHVLGQSWLLQITNIFPQLFLIPDEHEIKWTSRWCLPRTGGTSCLRTRGLNPSAEIGIIRSFIVITALLAST